MELELSKSLDVLIYHWLPQATGQTLSIASNFQAGGFLRVGKMVEKSTKPMKMTG